MPSNPTSGVGVGAIVGVGVGGSGPFVGNGVGNSVGVSSGDGTAGTNGVGVGASVGMVAGSTVGSTIGSKVGSGGTFVCSNVGEDCDVAVGSSLGSRVGSMVGDGGGVNGNEGVGTAVGVGEEARSSVPESCGRIPNPYNPPTTAPTMAKTNTRISNLEGPAYSGCVSSIRQDYIAKKQPLVIIYGRPKENRRPSRT